MIFAKINILNSFKTCILLNLKILFIFLEYLLNQFFNHICAIIIGNIGYLIY